MRVKVLQIKAGQEQAHKKMNKVSIYLPQKNLYNYVVT